ncbi:NusA N-terminal domain-containing protein [Treponema saccharophilum]|uniref:NusA domain-containing protein n=1 Tax=Treponema saccharophilum DSM 2985 TaxID=907348 RepID=H7ELP7_9SPIR|nr:NusA N-terminal domain-containing protein [Treponema saccharophilum]EIC01588.1 NusA domain-containing protein [Treponema saccharophilum DSM 2985]BDC95506.1 hypothetical protein TRSA_06050 [Treponema saccharophilum]
MNFVDENIKRLIKQCDGGDEAMTFLAIYSFIEGYFRDLYPSEFKYEDDIKFHHIMDKIKSRHLKTSFPAEINLYETLKKYHGEKNPNAYKNLRTAIDTNRIRHCFSNIRPGTLSVIVGQFIDFARYRGFLTDEISNMNISKPVSDSRSKIQLEPTDDSVLYDLKNDLLSKYTDVSKLFHEKTRIASELENIDSQIINESNIQNLQALIRNKKEKSEYLTRINAKLDTLREYTDFINELAISLIEARSKKNYETQIIHLSEPQKRLIKEDVDGLTERDGHSMYIKGGPGTGKTLVLIVILFKLYFAEHKSVLLTYYPTLNKYISYLFELYNDDKLLKYFGLSKIDPVSLKNLSSTGILKFDDFLLSKIRKLLEVKNTYSLRDNATILTEICHSVEPNPRKAARLYEEIVENVLPNKLNEEKYCTSQRKRERWEKISKVLEALDDSSNMLDLYAYYKFCLRDISKIALTNESCDYILIDEAQDLTNAQIFAINKFVNKKGGLILAGDPSQEIRNKRVSMAQLDVNISGGKRYNPELTQNFRSSRLIQDLGNDYKQEPCLHIRKNTKSVEGITAGPPPQIFLTDDTEESNYQNTYAQIISSVKMCTNDLCITPENICIVAFNESELVCLQQELAQKLEMESVFLYKDFSFKDNEKANGKIRLCTLREIKGIDCAVLLFMVTDQSKQKNNGGFKSELKANAIYTCITRAMYLLQVFIPKYCRMSDLSVAVLVNKLCPSDTEVAEFVEEQNKKERKGIPLKEYFEKYKGEPESEVLRKVEISLKEFYEKQFGTDENCVVEYSEDSLIAYVYARKRVVQNVQDGLTEISLTEARSIRPECNIDDEIEVYVNPKTLSIKQSEINMTEDESKPFVKILTEVYEQYPERRTDENGNSLPNSEEGYLNIAGCGLAKPLEFGYEKWPILIKDNPDNFDWTVYDGKGTVKVFAFRPKVVKNVNKVIVRKQTIISTKREESGELAKLPTLEQIKYAIKKAKTEDNGTVLLKNARVVIKDDFDITISADMLKVLVIQNPNIFELSKNLSGKNAVRIIEEKTAFQANSLTADEYVGIVLEKDEKKMQISTGDMPVQYRSFAYFPAYANSNGDLWNSCNKGDTVCFKVIDNPVLHGMKMAKLLTVQNKAVTQTIQPVIIPHSLKAQVPNSGVNTYIFVADSLGVNKTPNLKGYLQNSVEGISRASISKVRLQSKNIQIAPSLIGKKFLVILIEKNSQCNSWILDVVKMLDE